MQFQNLINWSWIILIISISVVRKYHERKAKKRSSLANTPFFEALFMLLWGVAAGVIPFFYIFSDYIKFADYTESIPLPLGAGGILVFIAAIWLLHRSHTDLGKNWSSSLTTEGKELITGGVYKYIRHPMYSAHFIWGIAQALLFPNYLAGPLALIFIIFTIILRIPREEKHLIEEFGVTYQQYKENTGGLFPKL